MAAENGGRRLEDDEGDEEDESDGGLESKGQIGLLDGGRINSRIDSQRSDPGRQPCRRYWQLRCWCDRRD